MVLRDQQREHSFILLDTEEFSQFTAAHRISLPSRHRDHFGRILRRNSEWPALVGDGSGRLVRAAVLKDTIEANSEVSLLTRQVRRVTLVQAWVKQKALAWILQKASELGVAEIMLLDSDFSSPHSEKTERMQAITENACMQAYNPFKPAIRIIRQLQDISLERENSFFGDLSASEKLTGMRLQEGQSAVFLNGPEGGWSEKELGLLGKKARGILLSENVLRAETAAIIAAGFLTLQ